MMREESEVKPRKRVLPSINLRLSEALRLYLQLEHVSGWSFGGTIRNSMALPPIKSDMILNILRRKTYANKLPKVTLNRIINYFINNPQELAKLMDIYRRVNNITLVDIAAQIDMPHSSLHKWVTGVRDTIDQGTLLRIIDWLLQEPGEQEWFYQELPHNFRLHKSE